VGRRRGGGFCLWELRIVLSHGYASTKGFFRRRDVDHPPGGKGVRELFDKASNPQDVSEGEARLEREGRSHLNPLERPPRRKKRTTVQSTVHLKRGGEVSKGDRGKRGGEGPSQEKSTLNLASTLGSKTHPTRNHCFSQKVRNCGRGQAVSRAFIISC